MGSKDRKGGLGRGLESLLGDAIKQNQQISAVDSDTNNTSSSIAKISVTNIEANHFQPRTEFEKEGLLELSASIKELGIIQPITVRKLSKGKFQLISGERRLRASQAAGLTEVPAYVRVANDQAMLEMALVENIQRRDLNPMEVALSYDRLIQECNLTHEELGERVGKNRASTSNYLRLLGLPAEIQLALSSKQISFGHGRALAALSDEEVQLYIFEQIKKDSWSVRKLEEEIRISKNPNPIVPKKSKPLLSFSQQKFHDDLKHKLKTAVQIKTSNKGGGKIVIDFNSDEDLERLIEILDV